MTKRATKARGGIVALRNDLVLRVQLASIAPEIWRVGRVPGEFTLAQLHRILQLVFGWQDYHLYEFEIGTRRFEEPGEEAVGESTAVRLNTLGLTEGDVFLYRYDFGDNWEHIVAVESILPATASEEPRWPHLVDGARASSSPTAAFGPMVRLSRGPPPTPPG